MSFKESKYGGKLTLHKMFTSL